jgi:predicted phosphoribosyltransferase/pimeloyl-ACP methyl ester carboxylesterase
MRFHDRTDAGRQLGRRVAEIAESDAVVLGLPRGGVPVAAEVARALGAPLDVIIVRKLGVPRWPELAMGAIGEDGVHVFNHDVISQASVSEAQIHEVEDAERKELGRRLERLRRGRPPVSIAGRTAVIVDDGLATGATMRAACAVARAREAGRVVATAPVGAPAAVGHVRPAADEVIVLAALDGSAVGSSYDDFAQVPDAEVARLLQEARGGADPAADPADQAVADIDVDAMIPTGSVTLQGRLRIPAVAAGVVVFVHGSGSSRHSPRNVMVADALNSQGIGTLLMDLLTDAEAGNRQLVFDIALLTDRVRAAVAWLRGQPGLAGRSVGLFGASTGAAAALCAAAYADTDVAAVVCRSGRSDLAIDYLPQVTAPTLLIVGARDRMVVDLNRRALDGLRCPRKLTTVPNAGHLFEEPGTLAVVADAAGAWFADHLRRSSGPAEARTG